jgi:hypothetical protein
MLAKSVRDWMEIAFNSQSNDPQSLTTQTEPVTHLSDEPYAGPFRSPPEQVVK